jgi:hypothetical protein
MSKKTRIFTQQELLNVDIKNGNITYHMAHVLKDLGAPIKFNILDINLKPEDIEITGYIRHSIKMDESREFVFEVDDDKA